jgi:hypothetical protein
MATVVRVSGPPDVIEFERGDRRTPKGELLARRRIEIDPPDDGGRGGKPYLIRFFRELH